MVYENLAVLNPAMIIGLLVLMIWSAIWKGIGLWKAGRNNQIIWFIFILLLNTAGILPIIYIVGFQKKGKKRRR